MNTYRGWQKIIFKWSQKKIIINRSVIIQYAPVEQIQYMILDYMYEIKRKNEYVFERIKQTSVITEILALF